MSKISIGSGRRVTNSFPSFVFDGTQVFINGLTRGDKKLIRISSLPFTSSNKLPLKILADLLHEINNNPEMNATNIEIDFIT